MLPHRSREGSPRIRKLMTRINSGPLGRHRQWNSESRGNVRWITTAEARGLPGIVSPCLKGPPTSGEPHRLGRRNHRRRGSHRQVNTTSNAKGRHQRHHRHLVLWEEPRRDPCLSRLRRALVWKALLDVGALSNRAALAWWQGVSRAHVTQVMRLLA